MYEPKFTEDKSEFATETVIEFNTACPHCGKPNFHGITTFIIKDVLAFQCPHCEEFFVIQYYAFPPDEKREESIFRPFFYGVYKVDKEPTDTERSYGVFEADQE